MILQKKQVHSTLLPTTRFLPVLLIAALILASLNFSILQNDVSFSTKPIGNKEKAVQSQNQETINHSAMYASSTIDSPLISRVWHGWTTKANADRFETLLREQVLPGFAKSKIKGYKGCQLLRRELENEVEFTTIMWFDSIASIKSFAGEDYETAHIDPSVRALFTRYDQKSVHSEVRYVSVIRF